VQQDFITLTSFFDEILQPLSCENATKAYIISIYTKYRRADHDLSKDSLTLLFAQAKEKQDFMSFQDIGDWIFFTNTIIPLHLKNASSDYYHTLGQISYYSCYKLIKKQWKLFEELSDNFIMLEKEAKKLLNNKNFSGITLKT
jgi:hypothetical protein